MNKEIEDLLADTGEIETVEFNLDEIKKNIPQYSNEKLCEMIVCDRYFGLEQKISSVCMEELSKRRDAGDKFNFEDYIEAQFLALPVLDLIMPDIRNILNQAINKKIK